MLFIEFCQFFNLMTKDSKKYIEFEILIISLIQKNSCLDFAKSLIKLFVKMLNLLF